MKGAGTAGVPGFTFVRSVPEEAMPDAFPRGASITFHS
jgi:hypothetical protein